MPARLNRRRYREVVVMLKEVVADPKATRKERLRAGETLLAIYERHDRSEEAKARRKNTEALLSGASSRDVSEPVRPSESAEEAAARFLGMMREGKQ